MTAATAPTWPTDGVARIAYEPSKLPTLGDQPGTNRFDDPRPRTIDRFLMRYAASSIRGCLLELLAAFRPNAEADARLAGVDTDDPNLVEAPPAPDWQPVQDFLADRKVATITAADPAVVSVNDPATQAELDREPGVRAILDTPAAQAALLEGGGRQVHLDNAAIRLASRLGRSITQACALALRDRPARPEVIHYRSRHDDTEDCWAIYDHTKVTISPAEDLSPTNNDHASAVRSVTALWNLPLPPDWST